MKKIAVLFALALFAAPFVASAQDVPSSVDVTPSSQGFSSSASTLSTTPDTSDFQSSPSTPSAGQFVPLAPIPGLTDQQPSNNMAEFFNNLYKFLIGLAAAAAVIEIIWGGLEYATQDSPGSKSNGRARIQQAVLGLVLVLMPVLVFTIINPSILNLSVNWQAVSVQNTTGTTNPSSTTPPPSTTDASGCTVTGTVLKQASCSTQGKAQDFAASCSGTVLPCQTQNSSGCTDTTYHAVCTATQGPYVFIDTSQAGFSFSGIVNAIVGYSHFEPLAVSDSDPNNGSEVMQFVSSCAADGGTVCLSNTNVSSTRCTYNTSLSTSQNNTCYSKSISCVTDDSSFYSTQLCAKNPNFTVIH